MLKLQGVSVQAAAVLDWVEDMYDQPISELDIQRTAAKENWVDMASFNMQLHGVMVSLMEECTEGFEIVRNTKTEVGLDAWRRLNHKYDARNPVAIHIVAGKAARTVASWLCRRGRKHGETRA